MTIKLITSPGDSYLNAIVAALDACRHFELITAFASTSGLERVQKAIDGVMLRGGAGRVVVAVDRRAFNTSAVFEQLLLLRDLHRPRLSLGIVLEATGLMHAKALLTRTEHAEHLIVGSANLTSSALSNNHELGVSISNLPGDLQNDFRRFSNNLAPRSLDGEDAEQFLILHGLLPPRQPPSPHSKNRVEKQRAQDDVANFIDQLPTLTPTSHSVDEYLRAIVDRGYLVGRGRQGLESFVSRIPQEQLLRNRLIRPAGRKTLARAAHETRRIGYGIDLIPSDTRRELRRDQRRMSKLLGRLTLNLPCFGLWMPETYWEPFVQAQAVLLDRHSHTPEAVRKLAEDHKAYLRSGGLETETAAILNQLEHREILVPGKRELVRQTLLTHFEEEVERRTPDLLASCIEWRTGRQRWSPYDQTDMPYRQLMADIARGVLAATFRSGDWPRRTTSLVGGQILHSIETKLESVKYAADGSMALQILAQASTWENRGRAIDEVLAEFRKLVGDELHFTPPSVDDLTKVAVASGDDDNDGEDDDGLEL